MGKSKKLLAAFCGFSLLTLGALDVQAALFEQGLQTGTVQIHLPAAPATDSEELSGADLSEVAAGQVPCCCCCC